MRDDYPLVEKPGVTVILINDKKVLLLRRINIPFITHPGIWYVVAGSRKRGETPVDTAYRELREETRIGKPDLKLLHESDVIVLDEKAKIRWHNRLFVMQSSTSSVKLNIEHTGYRWVNVQELKKYPELIGSFGES